VLIYTEPWGQIHWNDRDTPRCVQFALAEISRCGNFTLTLQNGIFECQAGVGVYIASAMLAYYGLCLAQACVFIFPYFAVCSDGRQFAWNVSAFINMILGATGLLVAVMLWNLVCIPNWERTIYNGNSHQLTGGTNIVYGTLSITIAALVIVSFFVLYHGNALRARALRNRY
jgi:multisubunit Na+/H+ antiporter MnhB subunit